MNERPSLTRRLPRRWPLICAGVLLAGQVAAQDAALSPQREASVPDERIAALRLEAAAHEHGNGMPRDGERAAALYCRAAKLGDAASQFDLGWLYANGRGVARDDALAAAFFRLAAAQGVEQARNMLKQLPEPPAGLPECLRDPPPAPPPAPVVAEAAPPRIEPPPLAPAPLVALVRRIAPEYRVPPALVWAIMHAESNFNSAAVSPKNAQGLMQLIPETAQRFRVRNAFDPVQNVRGGMAYLRWLLAYFEGDVALVAAAYNAGEGTVERYGGVPPYGETRAYVKRIVAAVGPSMQPFDASVVEPSVHLPRIREKRERVR